MKPIPFERDFDPAHGQAVEVSPLICRVVCNNPGAFTYTGTGTYIVGKTKLAVIDPGPDDDAHLAALLRAIDGREVSHIIITHTHMDHSPLSRRLKQATGASLYGYGRHGAGRGVSGCVQLDASGDMDFVPDHAVRHGDELAGPDWTLEAVFTPGHTSNHMAFALREERALFPGDHVMSWSTSVIAPPDGNMADYLASLDHLLVRDDEIYWPAHGPPKTNPKPFARAFATHRRLREEAIFRRIAAGDRYIMDVVRHVYANVDARLHAAAALSVLAHVEHLMAQGRVKAHGPLGLDTLYSV